MHYQKINLKIIQNPKIKHSKEKFILNVYHELFTKMYGYDYYDSYLEVILSKSYKKPNKEVLNMAPNSKKLLEVLESIKNSSTIFLLEIYYHRKLIGVGRLELKNKTLRLKEIALAKSYLKSQKLIWEKGLNYLIKYCEEEKIKRLYVEVPLKEVSLLLLLDKLGFKEDIKDIKVNEIDYTYVWNKEIESK